MGRPAAVGRNGQPNRSRVRMHLCTCKRAGARSPPLVPLAAPRRQQQREQGPVAPRAGLQAGGRGEPAVHAAGAGDPHAAGAGAPPAAAPGGAAAPAEPLVPLPPLNAHLREPDAPGGGRGGPQPGPRPAGGRVRELRLRRALLRAVAPLHAQPGLMEEPGAGWGEDLCICMPMCIETRDGRPRDARAKRSERKEKYDCL